MLSCNTGEGHNSTARAVMEALEAKGVSCRLEDALACLSPRFSKFVCNWHVRLYKYGPMLIDASYRAMEHNPAEPEEATPVYELLAMGAERLHDLLREGGYGAVLCTHVFAGLMMTEVRRVWGAEMPCYFAATDYTCSPTVESCQLDGYFLPAEDLIPEFAAVGLPKEKLLPTGIPTCRAFRSRGDRAQARRALRLPAEGALALLLGGSMGAGPIRKIALGPLEKSGATVAAVCGNNEDLCRSLEELSDPRLRVVGFTSRIAEYMDAADLIVTKPGGLTVTEAACKHVPMVLINAVGGCERRNFEYFLSRGCAMGSEDPKKAAEMAAFLVQNPARRQTMADNLAARFPGAAAERIAQILLAGTGAEGV